MVLLVVALALGEAGVEGLDFFFTGVFGASTEVLLSLRLSVGDGISGFPSIEDAERQIKLSSFLSTLPLAIDGGVSGTKVTVSFRGGV